MLYLIFHGSFGSSEGNWIPWLKSKLEALGHKVINPQMPVEDYKLMEKTGPTFECKNQSLTSWLEVFQKEVLPQIDINQPLIIVAHSLAPVFVLHILEKYNLQLQQAVFAAPFLATDPSDWMFYNVNNSFFKPDFDFEKLSKLCGETIVFYGDNDPYVPVAMPIEFADKLNARKIVIPNGGHLNAEFGYTSFPELFEVLNK